MNPHDISSLENYLQGFAFAREWEQFHTPSNLAKSDILCNIGYSYGTAAVERRLRQQGADL